MGEILSRLGARGTTAYLLLAYSLFIMFLAVWGALVPAPVVANISHLVPFRLIYVLGGVHLLSCLLLSWPTFWQRTSLEVPPAEPGVPVSVSPGSTLVLMAKTEGLRFRRLEEGRSAVFFRNRWSPLGTVLFHAALLLLPVAFLLSRATRFQGDAWIVEGHPFRGTRAEYYKVEPPEGFSARAPRIAFDVESVEAFFWGNRLFFTDLRALLAVPRGEVADAHWIRLPQPAWMDGARVSIRGFNYTPAFELVGADGALALSGDLNLRLFPPGTEDSFALPGLPHRFWVRLYPDSEGSQATPVNRGYDLKRPLLHAAVTCGKRLVAHAWLRAGEPIPFDGYRLAFPRILKGGEILVHRDAGYPLLWMALALALAGSAARIAFPSTRVWILWEGAEARAVVREDAFGCGRGAALVRRWGDER